MKPTAILIALLALAGCKRQEKAIEKFPAQVRQDLGGIELQSQIIVGEGRLAVYTGMVLGDHDTRDGAIVYWSHSYIDSKPGDLLRFDGKVWRKVERASDVQSPHMIPYPNAAVYNFDKYGNLLPDAPRKDRR